MQPWEYVIGCQCVKLFLLKYVTTVTSATVTTATITTVTTVTITTLTAVLVREEKLFFGEKCLA